LVDARIQYARPCLSVTQPLDNRPGKRVSRREFSQQAAITAAAALSAAPALAAGSDFGGQAGASFKLSPDQGQEVEAKLGNIVRKYGDRLTQEQRQHLRRILTYNERMLAAVRAFPLQNGDSPASVLKVSRTEEGKR
jgi:hypothetical protein